jgi:hypothetical protein
MARPELERKNIIKAISIILNLFLDCSLYVLCAVTATMEVFTLTYLFSNVVNLHCITFVLYNLCLSLNTLLVHSDLDWIQYEKVKINPTHDNSKHALNINLIEN